MRIQLFLFLALIAVNIVSDTCIYRRVIKIGFNRRWIKRSFWTANLLVFMAVLLSLYAVRTGYGERYDYLLFWFFFVYFALYVPRILFCIVSLGDFLPLLFRRKATRWGTRIGAVLAAVVLSAMLSGAFYGRLHPVVNEVDIVSEKLPAAFDGYRVVQLSDLHLSSFGKDTAFVSDLVARVNALQPDLILFTGDLVSRKADEADTFVSVLSRLRAVDGVWSVMGNHDYGDYVQWDFPQQKIANLAALKQAQAAAGWTMLDNASVFLHRAGDSIALIGVENWGEPPFPRYGDLKTAYGSRNDDCFKILMTHNPVHWDREVLPETNIDLSLSGHTHAMQMKLKLGRWQASPSSWRYPRWSGLYREEGRYLYVNEGIGCVFYPMRIGARPEITLLTLRRETARK